jgi:hypothetical protein
MQTHHAKNLQTMNPESIPEEMLHFLFFWSWTENLSVTKKLNPLLQNEDWKKKYSKQKKMGAVVTCEQHRRCQMWAKSRLS